MAYVVTEPCVKCRYTDCVEVCPVDCFREGENMLVIDPEECISCDACVPACPVEAIFEEDDVPAKWSEYIELNARLAQDWPRIEEPKGALPEADKYSEIENKRDLLSEKAGG